MISGFSALIILGVTFWAARNSHQLPAGTAEKKYSDIEHKTESSKNQTSLESIQIPKPEGAISKAIKNEQWDQLLSELSKKNDMQLDNQIPQLNYAVDTLNLSESQQQKLARTLIQWMSQKQTWHPRSIIILSKVFSKLTLSQKQKTELEKLYLKNKWHDKVYWIEASHKWTPCPSSTFSELKKLLSENRHDLIQDFVYFVSQMQDQNKKNELIKFSARQVKSWKKESKNLVLNNISLDITRSAASESDPKTVPLGKTSEKHTQ